MIIYNFTRLPRKWAEAAVFQELSTALKVALSMNPQVQQRDAELSK